MGELINFQAKAAEVKAAAAADGALTAAADALQFLGALVRRAHQTFEGLRRQAIPAREFEAALTRLTALKSEVRDVERAMHIFSDEIIAHLIAHFQALAAREAAVDKDGAVD